jgi:hypothetical protein
MAYLSQRTSAEQLVAASYGYDQLPWASFLDFKT